jgi:segregation and condensation protein B
MDEQSAESTRSPEEGTPEQASGEPALSASEESAAPAASGTAAEVNPGTADEQPTKEADGQASEAHTGADGQSGTGEEPEAEVSDDAEQRYTAVPSNLKSILEAALFAAGEPLSLDQLSKLFEEHEMPARATLREAVGQLQSDYEGRGVSLVEVASGFRFQIGSDMAPWVGRLWEEKPQRYSRAFLETLALIAYRQPITRAEIEEVRGVSVSSNIIKTLSERGWVRVVGHRDVPGKPAIYATTRQFLDYFGLTSLDELPPLSELKDIDKLNAELDLKDPDGTAPGDDDRQVPAIPIPAADIEPFIV